MRQLIQQLQQKTSKNLPTKLTSWMWLAVILMLLLMSITAGVLIGVQ